jgi:hypothetical protein
MGGPSRACHGEGRVRSGSPSCRRGPPRGRGDGTRSGSAAEQERPVSAAVSRQGRSYKPMVKSSGAERESQGVVVPRMGVQQNAPGGKGPCFGRAREGGTRQGMIRSTGSNYPDGREPVVSEGLVLLVNARRLKSELCAVAERVSSVGGRALFVNRRRDALRGTWRSAQRISRMPRAKTIGEPDAGKPHVRLERGSVETGRFAVPRH